MGNFSHVLLLIFTFVNMICSCVQYVGTNTLPLLGLAVKSQLLEVSFFFFGGGDMQQETR